MFDLVEKNENVTLAFVLSQLECGSLIREGRRIANKTDTKLYIVNIQETCEWGKKISKELEYMLMISKNIDAKMLVYFSDNPIEIFNNYIARKNVKHVVFAESDIRPSDIEKQLDVKSKDIEIHKYKYK